MFVRDILRCDSATGAWWFPKQSVSLTEGLFVKENTGMNLSMSSEQRGRGKESEIERESGGTVTEKVHSRLKRAVRAKIGRERSVERLGYRVLLRKRDKIDRG